MTDKTLSHYFRINRRYSRSINIERDLDVSDAVLGYIPTERSIGALRRIFAAFGQSSPVCAWTLTGVYGTGKSAFAHYLAALVTPASTQLRQRSLEIAQKAFGESSADYQNLSEVLPEQGFFRAAATAQNEPLTHTIIRALRNGGESFWQSSRNRQPLLAELVDLEGEILAGRDINSREIIPLIQRITKAAKTHLLLIIDELGKSLEYAAQNRSVDDLYLLQQLAELPRKSEHRVYLIGLLHQSFADYGERLATSERKEWAKIQGRFEDIPFTESSEQMTRLIGQAINREQATPIEYVIHTRATAWFESLHSMLKIEGITAKILGEAYPLHPVVALVLPMLCTKYAQNDRSLFTFLTSAEPYSFQQFLNRESIQDDLIPTLKLHQIYDYFVEAVGMGMAARPKVQKWIEIQGVIADVSRRADLAPEVIHALKTIGILNLITTTGSLRANHPLVMLSLCDTVDEIQGKDLAAQNKLAEYKTLLQTLRDKSLITYRQPLDELRIWEGSDFDVQTEIDRAIERDRSSLLQLLAKIRPLKPVVAQRHSYERGTLRYFECQYIDGEQQIDRLSCSKPDCDGLIAYWIDDLPVVEGVPTVTKDGKPLIVVQAAKLNPLKARAQEFAALKRIQSSASELQIDAVARREVRQRLTQAEELLDESLNQAFDLADSDGKCWIQGQQEAIHHISRFNSKLSDVCDIVYSDGLNLWNELINRRELTSQGSKARRELIEAMLDYADRAKLGLQGHGPEVSMYASLLLETGIHREQEGVWGFYPPTALGVKNVWGAIESFCQQTEKPQSLDGLYRMLEAPPYGVKQGAIPVLLAAILLHHVDDLSIYKDGTFIPVLGAEHFELLVRDPSRFAVKYFTIAGLRAQVFQELEAVLRKKTVDESSQQLRNITLLAVVKPLFQFVKKLPAFTLRTQRISVEARAVIKALQQAQEPDELLFIALPQACGLEAIGVESIEDIDIAKRFRQKLVEILSEIQTAYDLLLIDCQSLLYEAFAVRSSETKLREDLRVRAHYLVEQCIERTLKRFMLVAIDDRNSDRQWLEALVMIVADKPAESWTDESLVSFEIGLGDLARRFSNLEALQKEVAATRNQGFEAKRITVTRQDGREVHGVMWIDREHEEKLQQFLDDLLGKQLLAEQPQLQQALAAMLAERVLSVPSQDTLATVRDQKSARIVKKSV